MRNFLQNFRGAEKGSVTIEFVIGLPLLLLALVFIFEFSSMFWTYHIATNNVRDATRYLSRAPLTATFLSNATNIALTGDPTNTVGTYVWNSKACTAASATGCKDVPSTSGPCVIINQDVRDFTTTNFNAAGKVISVEACIPYPTPLFGLVNALSGGSIPSTLTLGIFEETRWFGE